MQLIGKNYKDKYIEEKKKYWPFKLLEDTNNNRYKISININNEEKEFTIEEILGLIFINIRNICSNYLKVEIKDVVVSIPSCFNIFQRKIIKYFLKLVELKLLRLIEKPLCDIIYLNYRSQFAEKKTILCYNLGSGYLSLSIIDIEDDGIIEVKAIDGKNIGGEDFDNILVEYCSDEFRKKYGIDFIDNKKALIKVKEACEDAKIFLSSSESAKIQIINLLNDKTLDISITREKFENLCKTLIEKCIEPIHKILEDSKISKKDINEVILVGGSVLIPKITSMIKNIFSENKIEIRIMRNHGIGAFGASLFNAYIKNIKDKNIEKMTIINKSPYSYGCEVSNYNFNIMIPKSSILPFKNSLYFLTKKDKQTSFEIKAFQIDNENSSIKYPLANLYFYPISPLPSGQVKIIVTYDLDIDLNLNISVIETMTNKIMIYPYLINAFINLKN